MPRGGLQLPGDLAWIRRRVQPGVVPQDRPLQILEGGSRLQPEIGGQESPRPLVGIKRFGLATAAGEGKHELAYQALPRGMTCDERLELADERLVPPEPEIRIYARLERAHAQLVEGPDLGLCEVLERDFGQPGSAPEIQRSLEQRHRALGVSRLEGLASRVRSRLEDLGVQLARGHDEEVA